MSSEIKNKRCVEYAEQTSSKSYYSSEYWDSQPNIALSNLNSEEDSNSSCDLDNSPPFLLEGDSSLVEKEIPLTDGGSSLVKKFYEEMENRRKKSEGEYEEIEKEIVQKFGKDWTEDALIEEIIQKSGKGWTKGDLIEEIVQKFGKGWTKDDLIEEIIRKSEKDWVRCALEKIKYIVNNYLEEGMKLNSYCDDNETTVVDLTFREIEDVLDDVTKVISGIHIDYCEDIAIDEENVSIIQDIAKGLLLKGGKVQRCLFYNDRMSHATTGFVNDSNEQFDGYLSCKYKDIMDKLKDAAYESIVNKNKQIQDELEISIDNIYSYIKYPQGSIVEIVKITNELEVEHLELKVCTLKIGGSIVRIDIKGKDRNYTDIAGSDGIVLTFYTSLGELEVELYLDEEDENFIWVEVRDQGKLEKLKSCNEEIGENCLLGGLSVNQAIEQGYFERPRKLCQSSERVSSSKKIEKGVLEAVKDLQYGDIVNSSSNSYREGYAENQDASMNSSHSVQHSKSSENRRSISAPG
ncbi:hypothetical protein Wcon_02084 [Wolbachia endosymbiont of Cylisticus convexus]|uniref:hypothetical protein n=1 Tax=Wolbachia endosymbiont of Cylisticus convexus TaxID=118728 RepID=UPI000DF6DF34|nr:hypothetical protein [Wolbachia endosymbiont of Cylisticus convexus]RDD33883.1 hypothetical protein Wcon_02084 [Wolbachia endosymbiont of Cylisticus convexus]